MKSSLVHSLLVMVLTASGLACTDVEVVNNPAGDGPEPGSGNIVGRVEPAGSGAVVLAEQVAPVQSRSIDPGDGSFVLASLSPGTYDVVVSAPGYRIHRLAQVSVVAGSITYVGRITLSTMPDLVESFAPENNSEVVLGYPYDRFAIGINFAVPVDRRSVETAFSTDPPTEGTFYWSQTVPRVYDYYTGRGDFIAAPDGFSEVPGADITTYRNIRSLRFVPRRRDTLMNTTYRVTLSTSARDSSGNAMRFPLRFHFDTIESGSSLTSIQSQPEDGDEDVDLVFYSSLQIMFPRRMDRSSVEQAFSMTPSGSPIFLWPADNRLTIYTGGPLHANATYMVRVGETAMDLDGVRLAEPFQFSFETEPVRITGTHPQNGQVFVDYTPQLRITISFNTYIVRGTFNSAFNISPPVTGQLVWEGNGWVEFRPGENLLPNTKYTVTMDNTFTDLHGAAMGAPYSFAFVTRPQ